MISSVSSASAAVFSPDPSKHASPAIQEPSKKTEVQGNIPAIGKQGTPDKKPKPGGSADSVNDQRQIEELRKIDSAVRAHEQAHLAAAGGLAVSGATYTYRRGPDGKQYAVGGEVSIDTSPGKTTRETISKAERIKNAALAPTDPSSQDRAVASRAEQMAMQAQQELALEKTQGTHARGSSGEARAAVSEPDAAPAGEAPAEHRGIASYRAHGALTEAPGSSVDYIA